MNEYIMNFGGARKAFPLRTFAASANMPGACLQAKEARSDRWLNEVKPDEVY